MEEIINAHTYENNNLNISTKSNFKLPKNGVSVNLDCDKEKQRNNDILEENFD